MSQAMAVAQAEAWGKEQQLVSPETIWNTRVSFYCPLISRRLRRDPGSPPGLLRYAKSQRPR